MVHQIILLSSGKLQKWAIFKDNVQMEYKRLFYEIVKE